MAIRGQQRPVFSLEPIIATTPVTKVNNATPLYSGDTMDNEDDDDDDDEDEEDKSTLVVKAASQPPFFLKSVIQHTNKPRTVHLQVRFDDDTTSKDTDSRRAADNKKWHRPLSEQRASILANANAMHRRDLQQQRALDALLQNKPRSVPKSLIGDAWD
jgi:hypothetical protein